MNLGEIDLEQAVNTRSIILDCLMEINEKGKYSHKVLFNALRKYQTLPSENRSFISRTVLGTVERRITIDYIIDCFSKVSTKKQKPVIRNILRMSVYQLVFMKQADYAVCNEAVKLAAKRGFSALKGFINGVLRNTARKYNEVEYPNASVRYSVPTELYDLLSDSYGTEVTEEILKSQFEDRPLTVRCNVNRQEPDKLVSELEKNGCRARVSEILPFALEISDYDYLEKIEAFNRGLFTVQDISSMLVGIAAAPRTGDYVIDVCGAPAGKSLHIAELLKETGHVQVRDLSPAKTSLIDDNIRRMGLTNMETLVWDATLPDESAVNKADILIADLPCSGLGIINKKPDIKYNFTMEGVGELVTLQRKILSVVTSYVKPGGTLIFSTCTINPMENIENVQWIKENLPLKPVSVSECLPESLKSDTAGDGYIQLLPDCIHNYDGFFIAKFIKI